jgi:hypothetical protein
MTASRDSEGVPLAIGEPIRRTAADDPLGSSSLTRLPRISADGGSLGPLTVRAASVCGRRHAYEGRTREDAFAIELAADGSVITAVADGIGNEAARYSAIGAHVASLLSVQLIRFLIDEHEAIDPQTVCMRVGQAMMVVAKRFIVNEPFDAQTLATTLITTWVSPRGAYRGFVVGDGGMFTLADGMAIPLSPSTNWWSTQTEALPASFTGTAPFSGQLAPGTGLLIATDGLSIPLTSPDVAAVLGETWRQPPSLLGFLTDMSFERRGEFDDRTGACTWYRPEQDVS